MDMGAEVPAMSHDVDVYDSPSSVDCKCLLLIMVVGVKVPPIWVALAPKQSHMFSEEHDFV